MAIWSVKGHVVRVMTIKVEGQLLKRDCQTRMYYTIPEMAGIFSCKQSKYYHLL